MKKILNNNNKELEDTIIDNDFKIPILTKINFESNHKIITFISEYMSLSLNEKIAHYLINKNIRTLKNPLTEDTIFHYICNNDDNLPLIQLMKPTIEEISRKNNSGQNLLHISIQNKCLKIAKYIIENKADINSKDDKNNTPLHIAVENDDFNIVKLLMAYNVKINVFNNNKETPIDIAYKKNNKLIINYLENKYKKKIKNSILNNKDSYNNILNLRNIRNTCNQSNINRGQNTTLNNFSDETKNETENQSLNIYKKKVITKVIKTPLIKKIKSNRAINMNLNLNKNGKTPNKQKMNKYIYESGLIYKRNSPRLINRKSHEEIFNNNKEINYKLNLSNITPKLERKNSDNLEYFDRSSKIRLNNLNIKTQNNQKQKSLKLKNNSNHQIKSKNLVLQNNLCNQKLIRALHQKNAHNNKIGSRNIKAFKISQTYNKSEENKLYSCDKKKIIEFLKEIGMNKYIDLLISVGLDDINLIIKQMNEGFPSLYETLKEIGISSPGDRAKILVRLQEISNGFNFEFPFEQVYFKNNKSIQRWLNREGLSIYINKFIDAGYQSFELLLIQMSSKYKITEKILKEEILVFNNEDLKKIFSSLEKNSEKYIYQLKKNKNIQRTYSKMVNINNNNFNPFCTII